jgi:Rrf2 family transcriptional regulator, cysteine metabolism repressor
MLRITKAEEQAVRLVMRLATDNEQLTLAAMAVREHLPEPTVAKLLGLLRRGGVVDAIRGRNGGYVLAGSPDQITTAQVLRAISGDPAPGHSCATDPEHDTACPRLDDCGLRAVWRHLQERVADLLEKTTIADLLRVESAVGGQLTQIWPSPEGLHQGEAAMRGKSMSEGA